MRLSGLLFMYSLVSAQGNYKYANMDGSCDLRWFPCPGNATYCVEQRRICDKMIDCPDGSEEEGATCVDPAGFNFANHISKNLNRTAHPIDYIRKNMCDLSSYPVDCYCQLRTKVLCKNIGLTHIPQDIDPSITKLVLLDDVLNLTSDSLLHYPNLDLLFIKGSKLSALPENIFKNQKQLKKLVLQSNGLQSIPTDLLDPLVALEDLDLEENLLTDLDHLLPLPPSLEALTLDKNKISLCHRDKEYLSPHLQHLALEYNNIEELNMNSLKGFTGLVYLYLRHNKIRYIYEGAFLSQGSLVDLELNYNQLQYLSPESFLGLERLKRLSLIGNPIKQLPDQVISHTPSLQSLYMQDIEMGGAILSNISSAIDHYNITLDIISFKRFRYCTYFSQVPNCKPKTDGVSDFEHLLVSIGIRVAVWLVAALTLLGNLIVFWGRIINRDDNKILSLFIRNLAVADLLTGVYLLVVGAKDLDFRSEYFKHAQDWMGSWNCTFLGILAMISSEVSLLILCFMSVERWLCITWPLSSPKLTYHKARIALAGVWTGGTILAIAPVFYYHEFGGFYGSNGLCFPLHLDDPWVPGWRYSALIYIGINQTAVIVILMCYVGMFLSIQNTRAATPMCLGDREFATRFFFIVCTDCICWTPIIILRILALSDVVLRPEFYAYVVVVLLPINSALNPFLYTFTTTKFRAQAKRVIVNTGIHWPIRRDSETEVSRSSVLRTGTTPTKRSSTTGARELFHLHNYSYSLGTPVNSFVEIPSSKL